MDFSDFSIVVLTFNRPDELTKTVRSVSFVAHGRGQVIVVDNGVEPSLDRGLMEICPTLTVIRPGRNLGVGARNLGLNAVSTPFAITLDDDVRGLVPDHLVALRRQFEADADIGALCFKVVSESDTKRVINWSHHRKVEQFADSTFATYEISEGAVALRMEAVRKTRMYPADFFVSHEGPALAVQLMNRGYHVVYSPEVTVTHAVAAGGRPGWRRYYYDTRNVIWLALGYLPVRMGLVTVVRGVGALLVYSIRDGFFRFWAKGVFDGATGALRQIRAREAPTAWTKVRLKEMNAARPGFFYLAKRRLFRRGVQI